MKAQKQGMVGVLSAKAARKVAQAFFEALEERQLLALPTEWTSVGLGGGGAFFDPIFNPADTSEIYCSSDMTGQYHSTNSGATWSLMDAQDVTGNHRVGGLQFTNSSTMYAMDSMATPVKSTDNGVTWSNINNPAGNLLGLLADYNNPSRLIISNYSSVYLSNDGGANWTQIYTNANGAVLAGAFFDGNNIYVAVADGVMTSTNGGSTFSSPSATGINLNTQKIYSFAGAKSGSTTRFFVVTVDPGSAFPGNEGNACYDYVGVYSMDVGGSWTSKVSGIPSTAMPCYVSMLLTDISTVYLAGGSNNYTGPSVVKSTNAGSSWTSVFLTNNNQNIQTGWQGYGGDRDWGYGEYADGFAVAAFDASKLMLTDMGAAYLSSDGGTSWHAAYVSASDLNPAGQSTPTGLSYQGNGLEDTSAYCMTWADTSTVWASFTDVKAIRSTDSGSSWSFNFTGHTSNTMYWCVKQPTTGVLYGAVSNCHDVYQWENYLDDSRIDSGDGKVLLSSNGGAAWSVMHDFGRPVVWTALDPTNSNRMYVSVANHAGSGTAGGIYVSNNINLGASSTWTKVANPPRTEGHPFNIVVLNDGTLVATYAGRLDGNWNYTASSGVFVSTNGGTSWTDRTDALMQYHSRDITIDPTDSSQNTWYVGVWATASGVYYPEGALFKTTNRGVTWTQMSGTDAAGRVSQLTISPTNPEEAYLTSQDRGLWYTSNLHSGATFTRVSSYGFSMPTRVFFNPYNTSEAWVTSFGYGLAKGVTEVGVATKLGFGQQPTDTAVNATITPAVTVYVQDANGNTVTTNNSNVTIALYSGAGTLSGTLTRQAVNGVATFNNLSINAAGAHTLRATDGSLTAVTSNSFNITSAQQATQLGFIQQPSNTTVGSSISPAVTVAVQDSSGQTVTTDNSNVTIALYSGTGTLSGTLTVQAVNGIATFSNLSMTVAGAKTIRATDGSLTASTSNSFNITAAAATKLAYIQAPSSTPLKCSITPAVRVAVQDTYGNTVTTSNANVIMSKTSGTGTLSGTLTAAAVNGIATFYNLSISTTGTNKKLRASSGSLTYVTSGNFSITSSTATKLGFIQQPTDTAAGSSISPAVTVAIQNSSGQTVTTNNTNVTIALYSGTGTLTGTLTVAAFNGIATFSNLSINATGAKTLRVTDGTLTAATSNSFNITAGQVATKLGFGQQPTDTVVNGTITPAVTVYVQDSGGNTVTTDNSNVTIALYSGSGTLSGTLTKAAVNGVATFNNLSINATGAKTLQATGGTLTAATSNSFNITASQVATKLAITQQPGTTVANQPINPATIVAVQDASGNTVTTDNSYVTMAINTGTGNLTGNLTVEAVNGIATFWSLYIDTAGNFTLKATDGSLTQAITNSFTITPALAVTHLAFIQQPTNTVHGVVMNPAITVQALDINNQVVTGYTGPMSIYCDTMPGGTVTVNCVNGIATFSDLYWATPGTYTIIAYVSGHPEINTVTSNSFTIS